MAGHSVAGSTGALDDRPSLTWFDAIPLSGGDVALIVGRGEPGSASQLRQAIRQRCDADVRPVDVVTAFDAPGTGIALIVAIFDPATRRLAYAATGDAGPILAVAEGPAAMLHPSANGTQTTAPYERELTLPPHAVFALSTEARAVERVIREKCLGARPTAHQIVERLGSSAQSERGATLALTLGVDAEQRFACSLPAVPFTAPFVRAALRAFARTFGLDGDQMFALQTAVGEAVANSIEHAYDHASLDQGVVRVSAERGLEDVTVWIEDDGRWRLGDSVPSETRGRGLPLMRALVDTVDIVADGRTTTVRLTLRLGEPSS